jgi:hypothetical protein
MRGKLRGAKPDQNNIQTAGIAIACLIIVALSSALLYRKYLQHEVSGARAIGSPNGINRLEAVRIGGIDQGIEVRGQNENNPILLFIHGGPGVAFILRIVKVRSSGRGYKRLGSHVTGESFAAQCTFSRC